MKNIINLYGYGLLVLRRYITVVVGVLYKQALWWKAYKGWLCQGSHLVLSRKMLCLLLLMHLQIFTFPNKHYVDENKLEKMYPYQSFKIFVLKY